MARRTTPVQRVFLHEGRSPEPEPPSGERGLAVPPPFATISKHGEGRPGSRNGEAVRLRRGRPEGAGASLMRAGTAVRCGSVGFRRVSRARRACRRQASLTAP